MEIGLGKNGRRAYELDEIGIVPARRTRDPEEVSIAWQIDAYRFETPLVVSPMDSVASPKTVVAVGEQGGLGVLDLEGLWTRYEDPEPLLQEIRDLDDVAATKRLQEIYSAPIQEELIGRRIEEIRDAGLVTAARLSPQRTAQYHKAVVDAGVDIFVIRGTTVSAEHVSGRAEPLNLKQFIYDLDVPVVVGGCATYTAALHLMRTGAAGVLVGFGGGSGHTTRSVLGVAVPRAPPRLPRRIRRPLRARHRRRRYDRQRRHRQGPGLRRRRRHGRIPAGPRHRGARRRLPLGQRGPPRGAPARRTRRGRHHRRPQVDPPRPRLHQRRLHEPHGRPPPHHGHLGLHRPEGVPAGGGRGQPAPLGV
ncbi:nitronate monooxygenase family protein [Nocardiopsis alba ATCC BAA-2165]|uniref:Nitronate monooxygenase family protein n=1 Tax=Nocardiopsis alba (strain ATCC BAA-2165 / BE74) TaxID=1205910 RepID=J7L4X6_NOCAA|nr:nitronate monooxygenase family protein [Nocardiopsis alba ATCC BAA-2165]